MPNEVLCLITIALMLIFPIISTIKLRIAYSSSLKKINSMGLTGYDVAKKILNSNGLENIYIVEVNGTMTDAYDSSRKVLRLSKDVYHGNSIAAASIAAHECGHAVQDSQQYSWFKRRQSIFPVVQLGEKASYIILITGFILGSINFIYAGVILMLFGLVFEVVTLPVELDASKRALAFLTEYSLIEDKDKKQAKKMLSAAAFTYVAAILTTIAEMLYYVARYADRRD
jgi:hypothetical protein